MVSDAVKKTKVYKIAEVLHHMDCVGTDEHCDWGYGGYSQRSCWKHYKAKANKLLKIRPNICLEDLKCVLRLFKSWYN